MIIRRLEGQEVLDALHLVWEVFAQDVAPLYTSEGVASFQDFIRYPNIEKKMQAEGLALFGAFEGPQMLGAGGILPTGHIALLFVRREYQHRGIGKALLMEMCSFAVQVYGVQKFTVNASLGAVDAYRHMGMHDTAPEQNAGGMRFVPMEMWAASVPIRKKRGKGMYIAGAVGALCLVLTFVVGAAITRELDYAAENGVDGYLEDGGQWGEDGSSIEDWYDEFYGDYGQDDSEPQEESGIDAIPEYVDEDCGYEVTEDNYTYTADNTSSTTIQFEVYYPQVDGLDAAVQESVNAALQDCALASVDKLYLDPSDEMKEKVLGEEYPVLASFVEYKVTYQSQSLLSVVFQDYSYEGSESDYHVALRCVNINLQDGTLYEVKDIVSLDDHFVSAWAEGMRDEADDDTLLSELNTEDMKAVLGGDTKDGVYEPEFFVDAEGLEIGLSFRYPADSQDDRGYAWVTAPFEFDEIAAFASDSSFWTLVR